MNSNKNSHGDWQAEYSFLQPGRAGTKIYPQISHSFCQRAITSSIRPSFILRL